MNIKILLTFLDNKIILGIFDKEMCNVIYIILSLFNESMYIIIIIKLINQNFIDNFFDIQFLILKYNTNNILNIL